MITLSILTPAVPSRLSQVAALSAELERQIGELPVEHLVLFDNKRRTVGEKRDALLRAARGKYVAFVDDDDWIAPDYVQSLHNATGGDADVITFMQHSKVNDLEGVVEFKLGNPNEPFKPGGITKRNAWHICAWARHWAICSHFPASNYGEDWAFARPLCSQPNLKSVHIDKILHFYRHNEKTTEAPPPKINNGA